MKLAAGLGQVFTSTLFNRPLVPRRLLSKNSRIALSMASFTRLVRFEDSQGQIQYGEVGEEWQSGLEGRSVKIFDGSTPWDDDFRLTEKKATISKVWQASPNRHANRHDREVNMFRRS